MFKEKVTLDDIKRFYQLKKLPFSSSIFLSLWMAGKTLVTPIPTLKKGFRHGWFITEENWGSAIKHKGKVSHGRTTFNSENKYPPLTFSCCLGYLFDLKTDLNCLCTLVDIIWS